MSNPFLAEGALQRRVLVKDPLFEVEAWQLPSGGKGRLQDQKLQIIAVTSGKIELQSASESLKLTAGQFSLIPASLKETMISAKSAANLLRVEAH